MHIEHYRPDVTVVLAGIGADTTNVGTVAPLYDDGRFEYVPIPEKTRETAESATLGSWELRYDDGVAADLTSTIRPRPVAEESLRITGEAVEEWPLHRDPNFAALTYGEHRTSHGYLRRLRALQPGDVVGFYAGLSGPDGDRTHRYLIGYFTVDAVTVVAADAPADRKRRLLEAHPENAHAKRASEGRPYLDKDLVIVDGTEPGGLFEHDPIRLSAYERRGGDRPGYYLRASIAERLSVAAGSDWMGFKPAYRCDLDGEAFVETVGVPGER